MNRGYLSVAVFLAFAILSIRAQVPFPGNCPEVKVQDPFDLDAYMGIWYEHSKYPFVFEFGKRCMYARYGKIDDKTVSVLNGAVNQISGRNSNVTGKAIVMGPGELAVSFNPRSPTPTHANYLVLATDYTGYAVVYSCSNFSWLANTKIIWILTRDRKPSEEVVTAAQKVIADNQLSQAFMIETTQDNCPEIDDTGAPLPDSKTEEPDSTTTEAPMTTL